MRDLGENVLSDYEGMDEDEAFPPLPPPQSPGQGGPDEGDPFANGDEEGDVSKLAEVPAAKRKGVRRPQPKLDSQRLISDRGLPALRTLFDDVHFKGKGHEASDLRLLMQKMENWAHRLYPKLQFEDFIDKVERLGNKKEVQTCLKRIRLDMPLTDEDFIGKDGGEEAAVPELPVFSDPDPDPFSGSSFPDHLQRPIHSTPAPAAPAAPPTPSPAPPSLTEEQRRRMEMNRQKALERRLARQQQQTTTTDLSDSQTVDTPTSGEEPTSILNGSDHQSEEVEEVKGLDLELELADSSSRAEAAEQPLNKDTEPSAESSQPEEEEAQTEATHQASDRCEDGE